MKIVNLEVAYSCNISCNFCYNPWKASAEQKYPYKKVLPKEDFFNIIDSLKQWGADTIGFSGGEPLLNSEIFDIAEYAREQGFRNALLTNGLLVEKYSDSIAENFDVVQISLHGTEKIHDSLTGKKGCFNKALMGRILLMDHDTSVSAVIVVNKMNLSDLKDTMAIAASMNMNSVLINRFLPGGSGIEHAKRLGLNEKELVEMLDTVEEASDDYGISPFIGTPTPLCIDGLGSYKFLLKEGCMAGKGFHCAIDPSGNLRVCNHSPYTLGNCLDSSPEEIYQNSEYVKGFTELRYTPEMCIDCDKLEKCKGGCRESANVLFGSLNAPDPIFVHE